MRVTELTFDHHPTHDAMIATAEVDGMVTRFVWNNNDTGTGCGQIHVQTGNCVPFFDWNVWDYETKAPTIAYTLEAFEEYVRWRLDSESGLDLLADVRNVCLPMGA